MTITIKEDFSGAVVYKLQRSNDDERRRPAPELKHEVNIGGHVSNQKVVDALIYATNLEWLSLNWRKYRAA